MNKLFLFIFLGIFACTSNYEKGEAQFVNANFIAARKSYLDVDVNDKDYIKARQRLVEIDSIYTMIDFKLAKQAYLQRDYVKANKLFLQVPRQYDIYNESQIFLLKIDSVEELKRLENERLEQAKTEQEANRLKEIKDKIQKLLNDLLSFKDKTDFHKYGFGIEYKYNKWLKEVETLKNTPEEKLLLQRGVVPGDLEMLGLEYLNSKGSETEYSLWAKKTIRDGLTK
jgi:hypothetical protein